MKSMKNLSKTLLLPLFPQNPLMWVRRSLAVCCWQLPRKFAVSAKSLSLSPYRWLLGGSVAFGLAASFPVVAQADGWGEWQPRSAVVERSFRTGFFNPEIGEFEEFEATCQAMLGKPNEEIDYWLRLSDLVSLIGTGQVEYGCRQGDRFLHTVTTTAVSAEVERVDCLQVNTSVSTGLNVRAWPGYLEQIVGGIATGATVDPGSFPASVLEVDGRHWVAIVAPVNGWISNGSPGSDGNLSLCDSTESATFTENPNDSAEPAAR